MPEDKLKTIRMFPITEVRPIAKVLEEHPEFKDKRGWKEITAEVDGKKTVVGFQNPQRGEIRLIAVCKKDGTPLFDQYQITEGPVDESGNIRCKAGAVVIPYFEKDNQIQVGLLNRIREVLRDSETGKQGAQVIELPRGFGDLADATNIETARRELGEETGKVALSVVKVGELNPNTAFYVTSSASVFAVRVDPMVVNYANLDAKEPILRCEFHPYDDVRRKVASGQIQDGFTLSALLMFDVAVHDQQLMISVKNNVFLRTMSSSR